VKKKLGGEPVKKKSNYIIVGSITFIISIILFIKFSELRNIVFDGDGIGIYLLEFEINDSVPNEKVTAYANGFLAAAFVLLLPVIYSVSKLFKQRKHSRRQAVLK
jgi:hypothetical protein